MTLVSLFGLLEPSQDLCSICGSNFGILVVCRCFHADADADADTDASTRRLGGASRLPKFVFMFLASWGISSRCELNVWYIGTISGGM